MKTAAPVVAAALWLATMAAGAANPYEGAAALTPEKPIDKLVLARLETAGIQPALVCSDAVFVRRVFLDVIGTLPTEGEARGFILSKELNKRAVLIDSLLAREEFADYWAMKWCDLLRVKAEFPINLWPNAAQAYHRWIRAALKENKPYDRFVRELLTASGSNFRAVPPVNFYRALQSRQPQAIAQAVALTFMGARAEKWPGDRLANMAAYFSYVGYKSTGEWKEEIVYFDPGMTNLPAAGAGALSEATFPDGTAGRLDLARDPREVFADWLVYPKNPWFARNIANRVWAWLLGRGIIQEPDDSRPDNPPSNPALLAYLEWELVAARFDLKHLYRLILNSKTYQLACVPRSQKAEGAALFASYPLRRLDAEVLIDALCQITGTTEKYTSAIPEPFTFVPENHRSIALPDGSITSSFLDLYGRPARDTGWESERNNLPSAGQRLHLLNSSHIQRKLERSQKLRALLQDRRSPREIVARVYLTILSRFPTGEELKIAGAYMQLDAGVRREDGLDLAWALINSGEFLYRH